MKEYFVNYTASYKSGIITEAHFSMGFMDSTDGNLVLKGVIGQAEMLELSTYPHLGPIEKIIIKTVSKL